MQNEIQSLSDAIQKVVNLCKDYDGQTIDLTTRNIFTDGPFLHQSTDNVTEEESAKFERENPELFAFLRSLDAQIKEIL